MADQQAIQQIKESIDIVSLISRYIELKPAGKNFQARCPFHTEKSPSFMVSPQLQMYKCFGCQKGGDIFTFLIDFEHIDFREALEKLAKEADVKLETYDKPENKYFSILEMINKLGTKFYVKQLYTEAGKEALEYLHQRDYDDKVIKTYDIGFAPGNNLFTKFLSTKADFTKEQLLQSGLFIEKNGQITDKFNKRIMFPIKNERGIIVAFSGRIMPGNDYGPKYLNSPETPIFHKRNNIFGLYQGKNEIRGKDLCILCEGQTDTISVQEHGIKNIVAPLGTALTEDQLKTLKKYTSNLLILFDNDSAGHAAIERAYFLSIPLGFSVYANNTGNYKDLNEMIIALKSSKEDVETKLQDLIKNKQDAFTYLLTKKLQSIDLTNYQQYKETVNYVNYLLRPISEQSILSFCLNQAEKLTGITQTNFNNKTQLNTTENNEYKKNEVPKESFNLEEYFMFYVLHFNMYNLVKDINLEYFTSPVIRKIIEFLKSSLAKDTDNTNIEKNLSSIYKQLEANDTEFNVIKKILLTSLNIENINADKELNEIIKRLEQTYNKNQLTSLRRQMSLLESAPEADEIEIARISKEINKINELINNNKDI